MGRVDGVADTTCSEFESDRRGNVPAPAPPRRPIWFGSSVLEAWPARLEAFCDGFSPTQNRTRARSATPSCPLLRCMLCMQGGQRNFSRIGAPRPVGPRSCVCCKCGVFDVSYAGSASAEGCELDDLDLALGATARRRDSSRPSAFSSQSRCHGDEHACFTLGASDLCSGRTPCLRVCVSGLLNAIPKGGEGVVRLGWGRGTSSSRGARSVGTSFGRPSWPVPLGMLPLAGRAPAT